MCLWGGLEAGKDERDKAGMRRAGRREKAKEGGKTVFVGRNRREKERKSEEEEVKEDEGRQRGKEEDGEEDK